MDENWGKSAGPHSGGCFMVFLEIFVLLIVIIVIGVVAVRLWGFTFV